MQRQAQKWISTVLASLLLWTSLPLSAQAAVTGTNTASSIASVGSAAKANGRKELNERRSEFAKHYDDGNGKKSIEVFSSPIHAKDEKGVWQTIDNRLSPSKKAGYAWENTANRFKASFRDLAQDKLARVEIGPHFVEWSLQGVKAAKGNAQDNQITYNQVMPGVDLRYRTIAKGVKEELVITDDDTPDSYRFRIDSDLTAIPANGGLRMVDAKGETVATVPAPFAVDATGASTSVALKALGGNLFELRVDERWLRHPDRAFPIVIDPSLVMQPDALAGMDTWISSTAADMNYGGDSVLRVGNNSSNVYRSLLKFNLASIPAGATITSATITLNRTNGFGGTSAQDYELHEVSSKEWLETEATWKNAKSNLTWTAAGGDLNAAVVDVVKPIVPAPGPVYNVPVTWNVGPSISNMFKSGQNYGFVLKSRLEDTTAVREIHFIGSDSLDTTNQPKLSIVYTEDGTPPQVTLSVSPPASGQVTLSATATDAESGVDRVEFLLDGGVVGTVTTAPYTLTLDTTKYPDGTHTVDVRAYDKAGNVGALSRKVILSDTFNDMGNISTADTTASVSNGMVSLVASGTPISTGTPVASSTKAVEDHNVNLLKDGNYNTYWKSSGQASSGGIESVILDLGSYYSISSVAVMPNQQSDNLMARAEFLDSNGNPTSSGKTDWTPLNAGTTGQQFFNLPLSGSSPSKIRLSFTNLTHDALTGLFHANVAEVQVTTYSSTDYLTTQQGPGTISAHLSCATKSHSATQSCPAIGAPESLTINSLAVTNRTPCWQTDCSKVGLSFSPSQVSYTFGSNDAATSQIAYDSPIMVASWQYDPFWQSTWYYWSPNTVSVKDFNWRPDNNQGYLTWEEYPNATRATGWVTVETSHYQFYLSEGWLQWVYQSLLASTNVTVTNNFRETITSYPTVSFAPSGAAYSESNLPTNVTDGKTLTHWLGSAATPTNNRSDTAWVEIPLTSVAAVNSVYIDPLFEGMSAKLILTSGGLQQGAPVSIPALRKGTYTFPQVTADKLRIEMTNLQGPTIPYYAGLSEVQISNSPISTSGQIVSRSQTLTSGTTQVVFDTTDVQPSGTSITYQLKFDGGTAVTVTPGVPVPVPSGALAVQMVALLNGNGTLSPTLSKWVLSTNGTGQQVNFQNGNAAATVVVDQPVVTITSPTQLAMVSGTVPVQISTTATDTTKAEFYVDGAKLATVTAQPWTWNWDSTKAPSGSHVIQVLTSNATGKTGGATTLVAVATGSPTNVTAAPDTATQAISLTWQPVPSATQYKVYRSIDNFTTTQTSWTVSVPTYNDIDATKTVGATYYYRVTAVVGGVEGRPSVARSAVVKTPATGLGRLGLDRFYPYADVNLLGTTSYLNLTNGNLVTQVSDLSLPGPGLMMTVRRTYNSLPDVNGGINPHWRWNHEITAQTDSVTGTVTVTNSDGAVYTFPLVNGSYQRPAGVYIWLTKPNGVLTATHKSGITWTFDGTGKLSTLSDRNGNTIKYTYDTFGQISQATNAVGRSIDYTFASGHLTQVAYGPADNRRAVAYTYDSASGALTQARDLVGNTWTYAYDADQRLLGVIAPTGNPWSVSYNPAGQVSSIVDPLTDTTAISYQSGTTTLTDPRGYATTLTYNATGQLTRQSQTATNYYDTNVDTIASTYQYDADYNLTLYTDPKGQVATATYDGRGNVATQTAPPADASSSSTTTTYLYADGLNPDHPTEVRSALNLVEQYQYDSSGNVLSASKGTLNLAPSSKTRFSYFANGSRASQLDMWGGITHYEYDSLGNLIKQSDATGNSSLFTYDWFGNLTQATDVEGNVTVNSYDAAGRQVKQVFADQTDQSTAITADGLMAESTDSNGNVKRYGYDKAARVTSVTDASGTTKFGYDAAGNQTSVTNPNGWTTVSGFDEASRLKSTSVTVTQPAAATYTTYQKYDLAGNVIRVKNANAHEMTAEYDNLGRQVAQVVDPTGVNARSTTQYDSLGRKVATIDPLWHKLSYIYDDLSRLTEARENLLSGTQFAVETPDLGQFTPANNASLTWDASKAFNGTHSLRVTTGGSAISEGVQVKVPVSISKGQTVTGTVVVTGTGKVAVRMWDRKNGSSASSATVVLGSTWAQTTPVSFKVNSTTDSDYFLLEVATVETAQAITFNVDALEVDARTLTTYSSPPQGGTNVAATHSVSTSNALGQTSTTTYDLLGRTVGMADPLGNTQATTYYTGQHLTERKDALGQVTKFVADKRGHISQTLYPDGTSVRYTYDGNGNPLTMSDGLGLTAVTYDGLNRPVRVADPLGHTVTYKYAGAVLSEIGSQIGTTTYAYNQAGAPVTMTVKDAQNQTETTSFKYDGAGHLMQQNQGTQQVLWTYDTAERLTRIIGTNNGSQMYSMDYAYDLAGNRTDYTREDSGRHTYTYDPLYRLMKAEDKQVNKDRTYNYDGAGNRLSRTERTNGSVTTDEQYTYDQASRLLKVVKTANSKTETTNYEYDLNGNQSRLTGDKGSTTFRYDFENRLLEQHSPDGSVVQHRYNGSGQRLYTKDTAQETYYLYAQGSIIADLDGAGATIAAYYRDPSTRLISSHQRTGTYLYQADGLGSVIGLTKPDGTWDSTYSYDEFGIVAANKGTAWNNFQFTSAPYHEASGLYHLGARYYNPSIGRFITQDTYKGSPWQPWTQNLYSYVGNNPVNYVDPTGHRVEDSEDKPKKTGGSQIIPILCPSCVGGAGHIALLVLNNDGTAVYWSFAPAGSDSGLQESEGQVTSIPFDVGPDASATSLMWRINFLYRDPLGFGHFENSLPYNVGQSDVDQASSTFQAIGDRNQPYNLETFNCLDAVKNSMDAAHLHTPPIPDRTAIVPMLAVGNGLQKLLGASRAVKATPRYWFSRLK